MPATMAGKRGARTGQRPKTSHRNTGVVVELTCGQHAGHVPQAEDAADGPLGGLGVPAGSGEATGIVRKEQTRGSSRRLVTKDGEKGT